MQGIIVAGGSGTRLNLFSRRVNNKHLALVYNHLVIEYPLNVLVRSGITDITIVVGNRYAGEIANVLGNGKEFGVEKLRYVYQKGSRGIAEAVAQAEGTVNENVVVVLGDNFFEMDVKPFIEEFMSGQYQEDYHYRGCRIFGKKVNLTEASRFGIAELAIGENSSIKKYYENDFFRDSNTLAGPFTVAGIEEKPSNPKSDLVVTGLYIYDRTLFDRIKNLKPSARGELEITSLNMEYIKEGECALWPVQGYWSDMGTFDSILETSNFIKRSGFKLSFEFDAWKE